MVIISKNLWPILKHYTMVAMSLPDGFDHLVESTGGNAVEVRSVKRPENIIRAFKGDPALVSNCSDVVVVE